MIYEIPLSGAPERFEIEIAGNNYKMRIKWNDYLNRWCMDISRTDDTPLIRNLAMVAAENLLEQYEYLGFNFALYMQVDGKPYADADFTNLGTDARLLVEVPDA